MNGDRGVVDKTIEEALTGKGSHVAAKNALEGLQWKMAGAHHDGAPHTIFQLLNHMTFWQEWVLKWLDGEDPAVPKHAPGGWPGSASPANAGEWRRTVTRFQKGVGELGRKAHEGDIFSKRGKWSRLGMLHTIASHNSYHLGQVVLMRQMLGAWPPPSGGITW